MVSRRRVVMRVDDDGDWIVSKQSFCSHGKQRGCIDTDGASTLMESRCNMHQEEWRDWIQILIDLDGENTETQSNVARASKSSWGERTEMVVTYTSEFLPRRVDHLVVTCCIQTKPNQTKAR